MRTSRDGSAWKGMLAGAIGGLAGSFAMSKFQEGWSATRKRLQPENQQNRSRRQQKQKGKDEPATLQTAQAIWKSAGGGPLNQRQKKIAGPIVHYAMGAASGAIYGALSRYIPRAQAGRGSAFGVALWALADEAVVPALGFSKKASRYPISTHAYGLASHLVYGLTADEVTRGIRAVL
ncbi:MAG TPA: DUF1440 domain-containing protein [Bryobacteraceae bacterium]|nr:DUF1440 domain-containing protein [Bryobacteraceae bacterium]